MGKITQWFSVNKLFWVSLFGTTVLFLLVYPMEGLFGFGSLYENMVYVCAIFLPVFILALISFFLKKSISVIWKNFTVTYIIPFILIILWAPSRCEFLPICKDRIFLLLAGLYVILSLILIISKSIQLRGQK